MKSTPYRGSKDETRALNAYVKLTRASETISVRIHRHLGDTGLTVSQFGVLEAIYHIGPLSQAELARKILRSTGNITMVIDNLEKRGLVRRERRQGDRRYNAVRLTPEGKELIRTIFPLHAEKILKAMNALTRAEQETLGHLCRKLGRAEVQHTL